jgi:hypothetical protein
MEFSVVQCLSRGRERFHSAVSNRLGSVRGGKKFDQSFRIFSVSKRGTSPSVKASQAGG